MKKVNPFVQWWATPKLPVQDIFENHGFITQWLIHPVRRRLARYYLKLLQKFTDITVIGITGSAGKSSTAQMLASILKQKGKTLATPPSIDPVYNIPNTILRCRWGTKYLILEMSVEYPGEMDYYLWLAQPQVAAVTNIYPTHTLFLGNVLGVAEEKGKLVASLGRDDYAVLNGDNEYTRGMARITKARIVWFGSGREISAKNITFTKNLNTKYELKIDSGKISILLPILGKQFVQNSLAAAAVGHLLGVEIEQIKKGIEEFKPASHRMEPFSLSNGALVIDDSYNNNPKAAEEALETFGQIAAGRKKIVVFGDMLELGRQEMEEHKKIGGLIGSMGTDYLIAVGPASKVLADEAKKKMGEDRVEWVESQEEAMYHLRPLLINGTITLIKGSRSVGLDRVADSLKNAEKD